MSDGDGGRRGRGTPPVQGRVNIDLNAQETIPCPGCNCPFFYTNLAMYKKVGSVVSPTGKAETVRVILTQCIECGLMLQPSKGELIPIVVESLLPEGEPKKSP